MKGRTSEFSLEGEIVSTDILTAIVSATLVFGFGAVALRELYHRRLAAAALAAAATCAVAHVVFVMVAWKEAASAYLDAHLTMRWGESVAWPPISSLPTAAYDASAWAAVAFLATGIVLAVIQRHRRKAAEKEMAELLMHFFGDNEPEESEED